MKKTVNIIEAINSGKRFRPVDYKPIISCEWYYMEKSFGVLTNTNGCKVYPSVGFINAEFELEQKSITITEDEFDRAWESVFGFSNVRDKTDVKKELGF